MMLVHPELWLGKGYGAFFHGPENTGKSSLAAIFAMEALRRIEQVLWLHVRDVPAVRFRENPEFAKVDDLLHQADFLVLDDLGAERFRMSSAAGPALEETVRILYERNRSVFVTSNFSWKAFDEHYSKEARPLVSVLNRVVIPVALTIPWPGEPGPDMPRVGV
jgi:DNA replication protein DnaC